MQNNESKRFNYAGNVQSITLNPGKYKLECYGAGGGNDSSAGGYGGYTTGIYTIKKTTTLYIVVGGAGGSACRSTGGGYNGGGNAGTSGTSGGGGGSTHIATFNRGLLANYASYREELLIVAAGGGGGGHSGPGHGGGLNGGIGGSYNYPTQTTGYAFGQGEHKSGDGGGGGSGFYGGYAGNGDNCGSGGSSYYNTQLLESYNTITGGGSANTQHGYAIITCIYEGYKINCYNCDTTDKTSYLTSSVEQNISITIPKTITKNGSIYYFNKFKCSPDTISIEPIDKYNYRLIIPANADYDIEINAIFDLAMRTNSDIYKNVHENVIDMEILDTLKGE